VGLISYHRAGVAKRQARAAIRVSRQLGCALSDVQSENEQLSEIAAGSTPGEEQSPMPVGLRRLSSVRLCERVRWR
jgi:hypothetical protein